MTGANAGAKEKKLMLLPIKSLDLHYTMIQFFIISDMLNFSTVNLPDNHWFVCLIFSVISFAYVYSQMLDSCFHYCSSHQAASHD